MTAPGTLAEVTVEGRFGTESYSPAFYDAYNDEWVTATDGRIHLDGWKVTEVRPLVVLDPKARPLSNFVGRRTMSDYIDEIEGNFAGVAVLRAVMDKMFPSEEPGLYGAVRARVKRDVSETVFEWFRGKDGWVSDFGNRADWDQLIVLEVLSEGRAA